MLFHSNCISNRSEATIQQIQKNVVACFIPRVNTIYIYSLLFYYNYKIYIKNIKQLKIHIKRIFQTEHKVTFCSLYIPKPALKMKALQPHLK